MFHFKYLYKHLIMLIYHLVASFKNKNKKKKEFCAHFLMLCIELAS